MGFETMHMAMLRSNILCIHGAADNGQPPLMLTLPNALVTCCHSRMAIINKYLKKYPLELYLGWKCETPYHHFISHSCWCVKYIWLFNYYWWTVPFCVIGFFASCMSSATLLEHIVVMVELNRAWTQMSMIRGDPKNTYGWRGRGKWEGRNVDVTCFL